MAEHQLHDIPPRDPVSGGELYISELSCEESGVTIRGRFRIPRYARLDADQARFLETFLRCRGMLNAVEKELGMSYPTVRARLDGLLAALDLTPVRDEGRDRKPPLRAAQILDELERGEIDVETAKARAKEGHTP